MTTKIDICNQALSLIGADSITSFDDKTSIAKRMKGMYDTSRKALLRLHPFNFATKRIKLSPLTQKPDFGYEYQYQLPNDLIRIISASTEDYVLETDKLLTDSEKLELIYVFDNTNEETFDSLFIECLILYLASKAAKPITGSQGAGESFYIQCQDLIKQLKAVQAQEVLSIQFFKEDDYTLTRRYG
ncbi:MULTISPECIES: hypothetical protein [unclassified Acinetobacter]|uniref:hypothetical protein n=1 Tax=unclassified Acinetobacter TaxID=196816 RepID=UPI0015D34CAF|nr:MULTISPECIES: hypothetical protein [unclassified Acinetobacter]